MTHPEASSAFEGNHDLHTGEKITYTPAQDVDSGVTQEGTQVQQLDVPSETSLNETARRMLRELKDATSVEEEQHTD